jgi:hypothetical protein
MLYALYTATDNGTGFPEKLHLYGVYSSRQSAEQRARFITDAQTIILADMNFPHMREDADRRVRELANA